MSLDISISLRSSIGAKIRRIFGLSAHYELKNTFRGIIFEPILGKDIVPMYHRTIWFSAIHRNIAENVNLIFILYIIIYYNYIIYSNFFFLRVQNRFS